MKNESRRCNMFKTDFRKGRHARNHQASNLQTAAECSWLVPFTNEYTLVYSTICPGPKARSPRSNHVSCIHNPALVPHYLRVSYHPYTPSIHFSAPLSASFLLFPPRFLYSILFPFLSVPLLGLLCLSLLVPWMLDGETPDIEVIADGDNDINLVLLANVGLINAKGNLPQSCHKYQ